MRRADNSVYVTFALLNAGLVHIVHVFWLDMLRSDDSKEERVEEAELLRIEGLKTEDIDDLAMTKG
jgi:hypothetical protein